MWLWAICVSIRVVRIYTCWLWAPQLIKADAARLFQVFSVRLIQWYFLCILLVAASHRASPDLVWEGTTPKCGFLKKDK